MIAVIIRRGITSGGVRYAIDDSQICAHDTDEERAVINDQCRAAYEILKGGSVEYETCCSNTGLRRP